MQSHTIMLRVHVQLFLAKSYSHSFLTKNGGGGGDND